MKFRDYQEKIIQKGVNVIRKYGFLYLSMEVRTGKTLTSLGIADKIGLQDVLFVTKKKAIPNIEEDYKLLDPNYTLTVINYESLHKINPDKVYDMIILDEAHSMGAFPKPSKRAKQVKHLIHNHYPLIVLLSGTPTPESYSQMYHQVFGIPNNPFRDYSNFYKFARDYVVITSKKINGYNINDYSGGRKEILDEMAPYTISFTQKQAGFSSSIDEDILYVPLKQSTYELCKRLKKDLVVEGKDEVILADTGAKMMSKLHQLYSGTVKFESGNSMVVDHSKAEFIKWKFKGERLGIFYKFKAELKALKDVFGDDICENVDEFDSGKARHIALQIVSGREGISLKNADYIVFYNIDFSATSYWQARDRMTTKDRTYNKVYWIFSDKGIEKKIYKTVSDKKSYTLRHFKKDLLTLE